MSQATQEKVRWTRGTVGVQLLDDNYRPSGKLGEVSGYRAGNLGIFRHENTGTWTILHQPSGLGMASRLRLLADAKRLGAILLTEFDPTLFDRTADGSMTDDDHNELNRARRLIRGY
jgi:hypothetical protein